MIQQRRLWSQVTAHLLDELIGIHQRAHAAFGQKFNRPHAFPLFQGKRRNRTVIYNAEYDDSGKLQRGVLFIATGPIPQPLASEQWSIGHGWRQWKPTPKHLERLACHAYDAVADEWNLDLAPLKMPIKLSDWTYEMATEFAQRSRLDPDHPQLAKSLRRIFVRGGHETATGEGYELPHEGLGGQLAAYLLAACRHRVEQHWEDVAAMSGGAIEPCPEAPQLWVNLTPGAANGVALGFPRPEDSDADIQLARYPRDPASPAENALRAEVDWMSGSLFEVIATFNDPKKAGDLESWSDTLHTIGHESEDGARIWNLPRPDVLESVRQAIKEWDKAFGKWARHTFKGR